MPHPYGPCERCRQHAALAYFPYVNLRLLVCCPCWSAMMVERAQLNQRPLHPWPAAAFRAIAEELVETVGLAIENGVGVDDVSLTALIIDDWYPQAKAALQALQVKSLFITCEKPGCGLVRPYTWPRCMCIEAEAEGTV